MNLLYYLRIRLNMSQSKLAKATGLTANDISRFERGKNLGIDKVIILAKYFNISVDTLLKNNFLALSRSLSSPITASHHYSFNMERLHAHKCALGRKGEDWVCYHEVTKLQGTPYANAVNPNYADDPTAGFDILSFERDGTPLLIEVKTTLGKNKHNFSLSAAEYEKAKECSAKGIRYEIHRLYNFGTASAGCFIITADELLQNYKITASDYDVRKVITQ